MLIPSLQAVGAVIGTIVAEFTVAAIQTACCMKYLPIRQYLKTTGGYIVAGFLMFVIICGIKSRVKSGVCALIMCILIGGGFYIILSMLINWKMKSSLYLCASQIVRQKINKN